MTQIRTQVDYHRQRLALHQRLHGSRPTSRLSELEDAYRLAQGRLAEAAGDMPAGGPGLD